MNWPTELCFMCMGVYLIIKPLKWGISARSKVTDGHEKKAILPPHRQIYEQIPQSCKIQELTGQSQGRYRKWCGDLLLVPTTLTEDDEDVHLLHRARTCNPCTHTA